MKVGTWLPVFPGFYQTVFEADNEDSELEYINEERRALGKGPIENYDAFDLDNETSSVATAKLCCSWVDNELSSMGIVRSVKYEGMVPLRCYIDNGFINAEIDLNYKKMIAYLEAHLEEFDEHLKERYTVREGFFPLFHNTSRRWIDYHIKENLPHCVGQCLDFILKNEFGDAEDAMHDYCNSNGGCSVVIRNLDELINNY